MTNDAKPQLIWGAEAIAGEIDRSVRQTFNMLERGELPAKKVGGRWVARRDELHAFFLSGAAA